MDSVILRRGRASGSTGSSASLMRSALSSSFSISWARFAFSKRLPAFELVHVKAQMFDEGDFDGEA